MRCRICGQMEFEQKLAVRDIRYRTSAVRYEVVMCRQCGVWMTCDDAEIVDPSMFYVDDYGAFIDKKAQVPARTGRTQIAKTPWYLSRFPHVANGRLAWTRVIGMRPDMSILDVGCGTGRIGTHLMNAFACQVTGIEPNSQAAQIARAKGLRVHTGVLEDFETQQKFDLVLLIHVLEHVPDPVQTLHRISQLLEPNGRVVIAVPNVNAIDRKLFGEYWDGWDIPRHVHHFSPKSLSNALHKADLEVEGVHYEWYSLFSRSLANRFYTNMPYHQRKYRCKLRVFEKAWGLILAITGSSSAMQVVAGCARTK